MTYQEKSSEILKQLLIIKSNSHQTDWHKENTTLYFKLSDKKLLDSVPQAEIESQEEYLLITNYIISEVDEPNFKFTLDSFTGDNKFLYSSLKL